MLIDPNTITKINYKDIVPEIKERTKDSTISMIVRDKMIENWDGKRGKCPFHAEDSASFFWNDKTNSFHCFGCGKNYGIIDHMIHHYGMSAKNAIEKLIVEANIDITMVDKKESPITEKKYIYPNRVSEDRKTVEEYALSRGISKETLNFFDVTASKNGQTIFNFYDQYDILTFFKTRPSRDFKKGEDKIFGLYPKEDKNNPEIAGGGSKPVLFGMNKTNPDGVLHVTEGEWDAMSLLEAGLENVVSIPFGANNYGWIEYNYEWFSGFERIVFWFDNDEAGSKARKESIIRLGHDKCRFIDIPKEVEDINGNKHTIKDVNDLLRKIGKEYILSISIELKELPIEGIVNLEDAEDFDPEKWDGLYTGIDSIDKEIIYKFFFSTVVTVTGTPGSGKSTLINQLFVAEAVNQGYGVTIFSGEMSPSILRGWIEIAMAGREHITFKPDNKFIRVINSEAKKKIVSWYRGKIHVLKDDDNNLDVVLKRAEQTIKVNGDKIIVLDNLATLGLGDDDSNTYSKQREMMNKLKSFASMFNVLIVLVVHPRKPQNGNSQAGAGGYEMSGSADIFNLCHYNFSIRRITDKEKQGEIDSRGGGYKKGKEPVPYDAVVEFYKNRLMGTLGQIFMYFDRSYRFYTKPSELWKRYNWDIGNPSPIRRDDPNNHEPQHPL